MCASEEVAKVDKLAVILVLDVDNAPAVRTSTNLTTIDGNVFLRTNDSKWQEAL